MTPKNALQDVHPVREVFEGGVFISPCVSRDRAAIQIGGGRCEMYAAGLRRLAERLVDAADDLDAGTVAYKRTVATDLSEDR